MRRVDDRVTLPAMAREWGLTSRRMLRYIQRSRASIYGATKIKGRWYVTKIVEPEDLQAAENLFGVLEET